MVLSKKRRKQLSYTTIAIFFFFSGVEYAVILPTLWLYIHDRYGAKEYFLGIILSAFSFSGLFAAPIMGRWSDKTRKTKLIMLFANLWEIAGNIMYFMGINQWFLLASRLVAGVGTGVGASIIADVSRDTSVDERTRTLSVLMICRQVGLVIGPGLNLFLRKLNFKIGPYQVDAYTSPGLFMAVLWILLEIITLICYSDLSSFNEANILSKKHVSSSEGTQAVHTQGAINDCDDAYENPNVKTNSEQSDNKSMSNPSITTSDELIESAERYLNNPSTTVISPKKERVPTHNSNAKTHDHDIKITKNNSIPWSYYYEEYIRDEIIAILASVFITFYMQTALEAFVTPLTKKFLDWGELENSLMYCGAGVEVIAVFVLVSYLSRKFQDRTLLLFGLLVEVAALIWMIIYLPVAKANDPDANLPPLSVNIFLNLFGLPFLAVCSVSLYSKITRAETQGFSQGIRRTMIGLGTIIGPLWGTLLDHLYLMIGVMIGLMVLVTLMLILSFKRLYVPNTKPDNAPSTEQDKQNGGESDEKSPLLAKA